MFEEKHSINISQFIIIFYLSAKSGDGYSGYSEEPLQKYLLKKI
jgi:hypothetical protein